MDLFTQVSADGSCTRRVEYRLERVDRDRGDARVAIPPDRDPLLRLHRFPSGEPWRVRDEAELGLHLVSVEAIGLASAEAIDGDYLRARSAKAPAARNFVSGWADPEAGVYEYQELLRDPASPLAGMRLLSRLAVSRDQAFARYFAEALADKAAAAREPELRRLFRDVFATPFAREVARVAERPLFGPRERRELEATLERAEQKQRELVARLTTLCAGAVPPEEVESATRAAVDRLGEELQAELDQAGLPLLPDSPPIRFRATVVMPAPILRANTCASGDTAHWEFEQDDLYGRGFEMKVQAGAR